MQGSVRVFAIQWKIMKTLLFIAFWIGAGEGAMFPSSPVLNSLQNSGQDSVMRQRSEPANPEPISSNESIEKRGDLYMARKFYKEAAETYQKAIAADPKNPVLHNKLGISYHQLLDYKSAVKAYRKAIQLRPQYAQAINNLAAVEYSQKHYKASILNYLKALKLMPNDAVIYSNLGTAYFGLERFDYAVAAYRYALQLDPTIFQKSGRSGTIVQQRDERNSATLNFYMAKTYADLKDVENSLLYLRKAWEEGYKDMLKAANDKVFAFLQSDPRYTELLAQIADAEGKKHEPPQ